MRTLPLPAFGRAALWGGVHRGWYLWLFSSWALVLLLYMQSRLVMRMYPVVIAHFILSKNCYTLNTTYNDRNFFLHRQCRYYFGIFSIDGLIIIWVLTSWLTLGMWKMRNGIGTTLNNLQVLFPQEGLRLCHKIFKFFWSLNFSDFPVFQEKMFYALIQKIV